MTTRQLRCGSCQVLSKVDPQATRFTCPNCGAMNTISAQARTQAMARAKVGMLITLAIAIAFTIWVMVQIYK